MAAVLFVLTTCATEISKKQKNGPFYIDLNEYPAYVKNGFESEAAGKIPDLSTGLWRVIEPKTEDQKKAILIRYSGIPEIPGRIFLSPFGREDREFTILIPFTISREQFEALEGNTSFRPGIFLAGIGDNWEILLNGKTVKSELHLDERGQIRSHRSWRNVFFPSDKSLFTQGANILAFRIVGAPDYESTGLFYGEPYFIGDYESIAKENDESIVVALCGMYVFIGFYHLLLFFIRRKNRYNLYYCFFSALIGIYLLLRTGTIHNYIPDSAILFRLEYGSIFMLLPMLAAFLEDLSFGKISIINKIYGAFCIFFTVTQAVLPLQYGEDTLVLWRFSAFCVLLYVFCYDIVYAFFNLVYKNWKASQNTSSLRILWRTVIGTPQGNIMLGASILLMTVFPDMINFIYTHQDIVHYSRYGFFIFTMTTTLILIRRFGHLFIQLDYMNSALELTNINLENTVRERTRELELQTQMAESASRAKSAFLARMSHEIRTPMNAVIGMSELALREEARPNMMVEYVTDIKQAGLNLLSIINDILDFSKIETGNLQITPISYSLASLINDVINLVRVRITEKALTFTVNIDAAIPNNLTGDEVRVRQILLNLLSNAAKYTHQGYVKITVTGSLAAKGTVLLSFAVADSGVGIKTDDTEKLFEDFVRLDLERNKTIEGTGLGLAITRSLCRLMGGDVSVSSEYGKGSVFIARILQTYTDDKRLAEVENPGEKRSLLWHENPVYAESLRCTLENLGVPVTLCSTREDFLGELETGSYAFTFMPVNFEAEAKRCIKTGALKTIAVLLEDQGQPSTAGNTPRVLSPAYAVPVANILNGVTLPERRISSRIRFVAPKARILLVDDIPTNLKVAGGLLMLYQIRVDTAASGPEAIEMVLRQQPYDIIFMDHMMPGMDGVEAVGRIRALGGRCGELPIIALTANVVAGMQDMFLENGFNDCLAKPIEMSRLDDILRHWIPADKREAAPVSHFFRDPGTVPAGDAAGLAIEGLDTSRGITMTGGSEAAYREILVLYCKDIAERLDILRQTPDEETLTLFTTHVHAIKSASASIGAMALSEKAALLEEAGKQGNRVFIAGHLDQFREALVVLTERIRAALTPEGGVHTGGGGVAAGSDTGRALFVQLREALEGEAIGTIDTLLDELKEEIRDPGLSKTFTAIADSVLVSDFKEAISLIDTLLGS
ncbi:MAG: response regulator [Spirochaetaceae bacterium]|nr:response regulator [Spirochaetaceae bacterium]